MSTTDLDPTVILGNEVTLSALTGVRQPNGTITPVDDPDLQLLLRAPDGAEIQWTITTDQIIHDGTGQYHADYVPDQQGTWGWRWVGALLMSAADGIFEVGSSYVARVVDPDDIRVIVPRVRRAVEGVVRAKWTLTDDEVKDIVADSIADVILLTGADAGGVGNIFGAELIVTLRDVNRAPVEYKTSQPLDLVTQSVIASQAALNYFFWKFSGVKTSEMIADEASHYEYALSPALLTAQLKLLQEQRDRALQALEMEEGVLDGYVSFIAARDRMTSRFTEPWVWGHPEGYGTGAGGLEGDFRFDVIATGGGDYMLGGV